MGIVGSGFPSYVYRWAATRRPGVPPVLPLLIARRPVRIKPWQKPVTQYRNAHHRNPSTVHRGFGPSRRPGGVAVLVAGGLLPPLVLFPDKFP